MGGVRLTFGSGLRFPPPPHLTSYLPTYPGVFSLFFVCVCECERANSDYPMSSPSPRGNQRSRSAAKEAAEKNAFVDYLNSLHTRGVKLFTGATEKLDPSDDSIFEEVSKGVLLARLVNYGWPNTIHEHKLTIKDTKADYSAIELNLNHELVVEAARDVLELKVVNVGATDLAQGNESIILGLLWQIIERQLSKMVEEAAAAEAGKAGTKKVSPEEVVVTWMNSVMSKMTPATDLQIGNLSTDLVDSEVLARILHALDPSKFDRSSLREVQRATKLSSKAQMVIDGAYRVFGPSECLFVTAKDIESGHPKLLFGFSTLLFSKRSMLPKTFHTQSMADLLGDDDEAETLELKKGSNGAKVDHVWIIENNSTLFEAGTLTWEHASSGVLSIKLKNGDSLELNRSDMQVVMCEIWDIGLNVTRGGPYKLRKAGLSFTAPAIYFSGLDEHEKEFADFKDWLDRCKIYSAKPEQEDMEK